MGAEIEIITEEDKLICEECGCVIDNDTFKDDNGNCICKECFNNNFRECDDCGHIFRIEDLTATTGWNSLYICDTCMEDYTRCSHCDNYYHYEDLSDYDTVNGEPLCRTCMHRYYTVCCSCDCAVEDGDVYYHNEDAYCPNCAENIDEEYVLNDYHFKPTPIFLGDSNDDLFMGVELEVDYGRDLAECCDEITSITSDVYLKGDGSLNDGFEIVSHPATLEYHMNSLGWEKIMQSCKDYRFKSHDTSTCGIHVHVSRKYFGLCESDQDLNIAKTILLINRFWETHIVKFSRRDQMSLDRWANKSRLILEPDDSDIMLINKLNEEKNRGRYVAVNLQNRNTVEFRIFRGTLNIKTFFAILQFVETICKFAKQISLNDIDKSTWGDIFSECGHQELIEYNMSKNLI